MPHNTHNAQTVAGPPGIMKPRCPVPAPAPTLASSRERRNPRPTETSKQHRDAVAKSAVRRGLTSSGPGRRTRCATYDPPGGDKCESGVPNDPTVNINGLPNDNDNDNDNSDVNDDNNNNNDSNSDNNTNDAPDNSDAELNAPQGLVRAQACGRGRGHIRARGHARAGGRGRGRACGRGSGIGLGGINPVSTPEDGVKEVNEGNGSKNSPYNDDEELDDSDKDPDYRDVGSVEDAESSEGE